MSDQHNAPFIPGWLDDAGLTPAQFRMFCHIARRTNCFESLSAMSRCCHMRRTTIQAALKDLEKLDAIIKETRIGRTCIYTLAPSPKQALGRNMPTQPKTGTRTQPKRGTRTQPKRGTTHLDGFRHYKGSPSEVTPSQGSHSKGESPPEQRSLKHGKPSRTLTPTERISAERQLERTREELQRFKNNLTQDAMGPIMDDLSRSQIRSLRKEIERLEALTRI